MCSGGAELWWGNACGVATPATASCYILLLVYAVPTKRLLGFPVSEGTPRHTHLLVIKCCLTALARTHSRPWRMLQLLRRLCLLQLLPHSKAAAGAAESSRHHVLVQHRPHGLQRLHRNTCNKTKCIQGTVQYDSVCNTQRAQS